MESRPEYLCIWIGLAKIGVVTALINNNLRKYPLTHSLSTANSTAIIFSSELKEGNFNQSESSVPWNMDLFSDFIFIEKRT